MLPLTPLRVSEPRQGPGEALHATARCLTCGKQAFVTFAWGITAAQRQEGLRAALNEHRKLCPVGHPEDFRSYVITYPRG